MTKISCKALFKQASKNVNGKGTSENFLKEYSRLLVETVVDKCEDSYNEISQWYNGGDVEKAIQKVKKLVNYE